MSSWHRHLFQPIGNSVSLSAELSNGLDCSVTLTSKQGRVGYLGACHLIRGQGDYAFYPGVADVLQPVGRDQLDGLKDHHAVTHYQLQQRNTAQWRTDQVFWAGTHQLHCLWPIPNSDLFWSLTFRYCFRYWFSSVHIRRYINMNNYKPLQILTIFEGFCLWLSILWAA